MYLWAGSVFSPLRLAGGLASSCGLSIAAHGEPAPEFLVPSFRAISLSVCVADASRMSPDQTLSDTKAKLLKSMGSNISRPGKAEAKDDQPKEDATAEVVSQRYRISTVARYAGPSLGVYREPATRARYAGDPPEILAETGVFCSLAVTVDGR